MKCKFCLPIAIAFALCSAALADPPDLTYSSPLALAPGKTTELVFHGKNLQGVKSIWTGFRSESNILSQLDTDFKSMRASFRVAQSAPRGIYATRVATVGGVSHPLMIMVDDLSTVGEIASNHSRESAQVVSPPLAVDGSGNGTESDFFSFEAMEGQWLSLEIVSSRLGYAFDALVRVLDADGREVAVVDDTPGLHGDCRIRFQASRQQRYYVEVVDSKYSSSARHKYRLRIVNDFDAADSATSSDRFQGASTQFGYIESDSNFSKERALKVVAPTALRGVFRKAGETFFYRLDLTAGSRLRVCGITRSEERPTDLLIAVYAPDGTLKATYDDTGLDEACFDLQGDQNGDYLLCVREINGRFGSDYAFRIEVTESPASFELSADVERVIIGQGGQGILPIVCKRKGYDGPITLRIDHPSAPYRLESGVIAKGQTKTLLKIVPSADLLPGDLRTIQITGYGDDAATVKPSRVSFVEEVRKLNPALAYPPAELLEQLAVSIADPLPDFFRLRLGASEVVFPRVVGELYFTAYCENRIEGFSDPILVEAENLPAGFRTSGNERPVGNSKNNEYRFQINGPPNAPLGHHSISVRAMGTFQGQMKEVLIRDIPLRVIEPLILSLELSSSNPERGELAVRVKATRFLPRAGGDRKEIFLKLKDKPDWLIAPESMLIDVGKNDAVIQMSAKPSPDESERKGKIVLIGETSINGQSVQVESEPLDVCFSPKQEIQQKGD